MTVQNPYLAHALEMVKAQAAARPMTEEEIISTVKSVAATIASLDGRAAESEAPAEAAGLKLIDGFKPKRSIGDDFVISGLDGKKYKLLTEKHFAANGTTKAEYLAACGLPSSVKLVCKNLLTARSEKMKSMELWKRKKGAQPAPAEAETAAAESAY